MSRVTVVLALVLFSTPLRDLSGQQARVGLLASGAFPTGYMADDGNEDFRFSTFTSRTIGVSF